MNVKILLKLIVEAVWLFLNIIQLYICHLRIFDFHINKNLFVSVTLVFVLFLVMGQPIIKAITIESDITIALLETDSDSDGDAEEKKEKEESKEEKITSSLDNIKLSEYLVITSKVLNNNVDTFTSIYLEINIPPPELG